LLILLVECVYYTFEVACIKANILVVVVRYHINFFDTVHVYLRYRPTGERETVLATDPLHNIVMSTRVIYWRERETVQPQ